MSGIQIFAFQIFVPLNGVEAQVEKLACGRTEKPAERSLVFKTAFFHYPARRGILHCVRGCPKPALKR